MRLIPPAFVKAFVKRQKNDVADAEAELRLAKAVAVLLGGALRPAVAVVHATGRRLSQRDRHV